MPVTMPDGDTYLTTQEVCECLAVSRTTLYVMRMEHRSAPSIRWGRQRLYRRSSFLEWHATRIKEAEDSDAS
jgi:excisionase family DNA binding protein